MKKLNLLITLFVAVILFSFPSTIFANSSNFFDKNPLLTQKLTGYQHNADEPLPIDKITRIIVRKGSFSDSATIYIYKANSNINQLIPTDQSPISSYAIIFRDANNNVITPKIGIRIEVDNFYKNTPTFYYPIVNGGIDSGLKKQLSGNSKTAFTLSINDDGYVTAINSSANPEQTSTGNPLGNIFSPLMPILAILFIVLVAIVILILVRKRMKQETKKL